MVTFIATAYKETVDIHSFVACLVNQKDRRWKAVIYCDAPNRYIKNFLNNFDDSRFSYMENQIAKGSWGHYNRATALQLISDSEFIVQTSVQDYYIPTTVGEILANSSTADLIYYNCLHNHYNYNVLDSKLSRCSIDWGSFAVRAQIAKSVGIRETTSAMCDGLFAESLLAFPNIRVKKLNKILTVHN
jgi:hypothetical protein